MAKQRSPQLTCRCGSSEYKVTPQEYRNGEVHYRADCKRCRHFVGWINRKLGKKLAANIRPIKTKARVRRAYKPSPPIIIPIDFDPDLPDVK